TRIEARGCGPPRKSATDHVTILCVELHDACDTTLSCSRNQGGTGAAEEIEHHVTGSRRVLNRELDQFEGLHRRMLGVRRLADVRNPIRRIREREVGTLAAYQSLDVGRDGCIAAHKPMRTKLVDLPFDAGSSAGR